MEVEQSRGVEGEQHLDGDAWAMWRTGGQRSRQITWETWKGSAAEERKKTNQKTQWVFWSGGGTPEFLRVFQGLLVEGYLAGTTDTR